MGLFKKVDFLSRFLINRDFIHLLPAAKKSRQGNDYSTMGGGRIIVSKFKMAMKQVN